MIALWIVLVAIVLVFVIVSKLLLLRSLFATKALQWSKHQKSVIGNEALWVWCIMFVLTLIIGIAEYLKQGNPFMATTYSTWTCLGLVLLVIGLLVWLAAMHARKQYLWYFQVLGFKESLPPYSTNGIYGAVRNPREFGLVLVMAGIASSFSLMFALAFTVLFLFATMFRVSSRDRIMLEKHGKAYIDYMRTSKRLIPYVW